MKLNATTEMEPVGLPGFADIHPFAPLESTPGYLALIDELEEWLAERHRLRQGLGPAQRREPGRAGRAPGHPRLPPVAGRAERDVCLIPSSAHGTNAASAVMAGMRVVVVAALGDGTVDLDDLRAKCEEHGDRLAAIMVTYPSTHGVYEEGIGEMCALVHRYGGQVYIDGANLNALLGLAEPGRVRRRRLPPEPAQDLLHPPRRRRARGRTGGGGRAPGAVPPVAPAAPAPEPARGDRPGQRGALRQRRDPVHQLGLHPHAVRCRPGPRHQVGGPGRQLRGGSPGAVVSDPLHGEERPGGPRVHPRPAAADQGRRASRSTTWRSGSSTTASTRRR